MSFHPNSTFLYGIAVLVILFVLAQSAFFLVRSYRRGKELGISAQRLKKTILSTAVFTIAPAISFLLGVVTLAKFLGIPLPWIRMSVIGAITYEVRMVNDHGIREDRRLATVNSALCQGCGACTVTCPSGVMDLQGFSNRQIIAEVDAICR